MVDKTAMMTPNELIAKLEAAPKGSGQLSHAVAGIVNGCEIRFVGDVCEVKLSRPVGHTKVWHWQRREANFLWPDYTESLDAAETLVPRNCWWTMWSQIPCALVWREKVCIASSQPAAPATPALALCIAAMKARTEFVLDPDDPGRPVPPHGSGP